MREALEALPGQPPEDGTSFALRKQMISTAKSHHRRYLFLGILLACVSGCAQGGASSQEIDLDEQQGKADGASQVQATLVPDRPLRLSFTCDEFWWWDDCDISVRLTVVHEYDAAEVMRHFPIGSHEVSVAVLSLYRDNRFEATPENVTLWWDDDAEKLRSVDPDGHDLGEVSWEGLGKGRYDLYVDLTPPFASNDPWPDTPLGVMIDVRWH